MIVFQQDIRFALRSLLKRPGFSAIVVAALAICIGANTAIFSVVDAVLLRALPYRDPDRLVYVSERLATLLSGPVPFSAPDYEELVRESRLVSETGIYHVQTFELSGLATPERLEAARISASLFPVLGIAPSLGRNFTEEEDRGAHRVVILTDVLWRSKFGADRRIVGRQVTIDRSSYTVVGVMPPQSVFPLPSNDFNGRPAAFYVPISFTKTEREGFGNMYNHSVVARLRPGVTLEQFNTELGTIAHRLATTIYPPKLRGAGADLGMRAEPLREEIVGNVRPMLLLLFAAVTLVLLIGCADIAGLLLTRAAGRTREMAIRVAVGASRRDLVRQVLVESLVLAALGGVGGLLLCAWTGGLLIRWTGIQAAAGSTQLNPRMLLFTVAISLTTSLVFGLAPAIRASEVDVSAGVRESGRGQSAGRKQGRVLDGLVVAQFALSLLLLIGAGLMVRSFLHLLATDPGFQPDHILTMSVSLPERAYKSGPDVRAFYDRMERALQTLPGVKFSGLGTSLPLHFNEYRTFSVDGQPATPNSPPRRTAHIWVAGDFFRAMAIPLKEGRYLSDQDTEQSLPTVVISEKLAREIWPGRSPIGQRVKWGYDASKNRWMTVVGVVANVKQGALNEKTESETYSPWRQVADADLADSITNEYRTMALVARTRMTPLAIAPEIERLVHTMDASLPVTEVQTMEAQLDQSVRAQRLQTSLLGGFATAALVLAALGIGGVLAYSVAQRTKEIGIRMALGATRAEVLKLVVSRGMKLAFLGTLIGFVAALLMTRLVAHVLYQTSPYDPLTLAAAPAFLCVVALGAILVPARRAATVDPVSSLRME